uniref:Structural maintenance of chromosomes protein n=1 Tax=Romanomermis culicivorax TaxID=13658 RepID=A0A915IJC3_ROMCU
MHVKKIVIDGFKSYAHRTEIDGFDPSFNAITGLNGSGKSNILDSICFVLGIKNLSHVRANNLQDLVYKNGQAGVTKATVCITFDNQDKKQSPVGYENYDEITITRQIVIGGRNKYLINGVNAQNNRVEDLFRSVQMNVNNPHFIIMQGRITKVLNMKPPEILSMVEEAAGTRLYESKKQAALKTIEKKDAKLREIEALLKDEIGPTLDKLKQERAAYMEYQRLVREIEHLSQLVTAYRYSEAQGTCAASAKHFEQTEKEIETLEKRIKDNLLRKERLEDEMKQIRAMRTDDISKELEKLEKDMKEKANLEIKANSLFENKRENLENEKKRLKDLKKSFDSDSKLLNAKQKELDDLTKKCGGMIEKGEKNQHDLAAAQKRIQALAAGMSVDDKGETVTLNNQLITATEEASRKQTEIIRIEMELKHMQSELKKSRGKVRQSDSQFNQEQKIVERLEKELSDLRNHCDQLNIDDNAEDQLQASKRSLNQEIAMLRDKIGDSESRIPQLRFEYKDPEPNFDRSRVKGPVSKLIKIKNAEEITALETAAGDRLNYIVIDSEVTGKQLLQKGDLKRRVTFIPLNKISAATINADKIRKAKQLVGNENCELALSLVNYDGRVENAMKYVFGNTFVCTDMDSAKKVTFHKDIMCRCVTLAGESFNPQGTLTGGSSRSSFSLLKALTEIQRQSENLQAKTTEREKCEQNLRQITKKVTEKQELQRKIDAKQREISSLLVSLENNDQHRLNNEIKRLQKEISEHESLLKECTEFKIKAESKIKELENKIKKGTNRDDEMREAESEMSLIKKRIEASAEAMQKNQESVNSLKMEIAEIESELKNYEQQIDECKISMEKITKEIETASEAASQAKGNLKASETMVERQKEILKQSDEELQGKQAECDEKLQDNRKIELKIKKLKQDIEKIQNDKAAALGIVEQMKSAYTWIPEQEHNFGKAGSQFDFSKTDMHESAKRLKSMQEQKEKLQRNINTRAMNMLNQEEQRCANLLKKKSIVESDKLKIEDVIKGLDEKKKIALEEAWLRVNQDFGSIFSTLLPNASVKLEPPAGQTVLDGLEVRVGFGNVWKESLSELSGGQRSLVALSLILAMLLFKPAPIYILDEVDAALDVSHTQNIGQMLKTHFKHSQFIVVSLKEGMFTNANVLFRTKFVDGRSTVARHAQQSASGATTAKNLSKRDGKNHAQDENKKKRKS